MGNYVATMAVHAPRVVDEPFVGMGEQIQRLARSQPNRVALIDAGAEISWAALVARANRIANRLREAGMTVGDMVAGLSENSADYIALYLGVLTAGGCMVPLSGMASGDALALMINDCDAEFLFVSAHNAPLLAEVGDRLSRIPPAARIGLDEPLPDSGLNLDSWLGDIDDTASPAAVTPDDPFNLIYSSGTTGTPKGILHDHRFRYRQLSRMGAYGLGAGAINLVSTPLYSNTTLVSALATLFHGGTLVLMARFETSRFLALSERYRVTHAILVPVQFQRLLDDPEFDRFDLSSFELKLSTGAPLHSELIGRVMARWPGNLRELYGLTEGGINASLDCAAYPDKWDTVGQPTAGAEIRVIDEHGRPLARGEVGELVGRAPSMMRGYYHREAETAAMLWTSPEGSVFYRSGDIGRVDEDGFVHILGRRKDVIVSGGFNIYAVDIEDLLGQHPSVADVAVIGIPSSRWGETPLALVVLRPGATAGCEELLAWANDRLGKTQRLAGVEYRDALARSAVGKILKRELRAPYWSDDEPT
ncbi:class I adenylate-forming enzyme family protein [Salinisphaera sp. T31B1]|uniref:class I adenylate-forming enzyme family protein n=1 Tax=Salinisphaera sp. T31B1 TaxID=727963 RepID=UPI0033407A31